MMNKLPLEGCDEELYEHEDSKRSEEKQRIHAHFKSEEDTNCNTRELLQIYLLLHFAVIVGLLAIVTFLTSSTY